MTIVNPLWPNPADTAADRARLVALMYRARLRALDKDACDECDDVAIERGEDWVTPRVLVHVPEQELTADEAAELVKVTEQTIRYWACCEHPYRPGRVLLPRYGWRGRRRTYIAELVLGAAAAVTQAHREKVALQPWRSGAA